MSKVDLAKKTAKLMVDKLSPEELENELYQLLILLSESDIKYAYTDVRSGEVAGSPHPVDVLQGGDDDSSLGKVTIYHDEGMSEIMIDKRDALKLLKKGLVQQEMDGGYEEGEEPSYMYYGEGWEGLENELGYLPMGTIHASEDDDDEEKVEVEYEVVYRFDVPDTQYTPEYAEGFDEGEDIYIYDKELDRWIQHEIIEVFDGEERGENEYVVEPIGDFGPTALLYAPFTEKEVRRKGEYSPIYEDNYIDSELIEKIKSHPDVEDAYIEDMSGVLYIVFNGWKASDDSNSVTVAATPGWEEEEKIPVQIDVFDGEDDDNYVSENIISLEHPQFYVKEDGVYPSKEKYHQLYYDKIGQIKEEAEEVYDNQVRGKIEGKVR